MTGQPYAAAPSMLAVTVLFLIAVLSVPVYEPQRLIWYTIYPVVASEMTGAGFLKVFIRSLWILPLVVLIAIFNPLIDTTTAFMVGDYNISQGWVSFTSIILRGLLSFQALILLVINTGFINLFNSMNSLGFPTVLTTQMLLTYRYFVVVADEAIVMKRAREARGYGRKRYTLKEWGRFIGLLLLRSTAKATGIHQAMKARGFDGTLPLGPKMSWNKSAWLWLIGWTVTFVFLRFYDISSLVTRVINNHH